MSLNSYIRKAKAAQDIEGPVTQAGREKWVEVLGWSWECVAPRDVASGLPTGKRQHKPLTICVPMAKDTPLWFQTLVDNHNIENLELVSFRPNKQGKEELYYELKFTNANVAGLRLEQLN